MALADAYIPIKTLHISTALLSGGVFFLRGILALYGSRLSENLILKRLSYVDDTILLVAGVLLMRITQQYLVGSEARPDTGLYRARRACIAQSQNSRLSPLILLRSTGPLSDGHSACPAPSLVQCGPSPYLACRNPGLRQGDSILWRVTAQRAISCALFMAMNERGGPAWAGKSRPRQFALSTR